MPGPSANQGVAPPMAENNGPQLGSTTDAPSNGVGSGEAIGSHTGPAPLPNMAVAAAPP